MSNMNKILSDISTLNLNTVNVPVKIIIADATSNIMSIDATSKALAISIIEELKDININVILEPYPWIASGTIPETSWNPSDISTWFTNWQTILDTLITDIANVYDIYAFCVASNFVNMETYESDWINLISHVKGIYFGDVTYRTNWWVTASWDTGPGSTTEAYQTKLNNTLFGELDFISVASYFELTTTAIPTVNELNACLLSTTKYNREQNVYQEIKNFYDTWGKRIFLGELGFSNRESCASEPWNNTTSVTVSELAQSNCFQAYKETFEKENWLLGFSLFCAGNSTLSNYNVVNRLAENIISEWETSYITTRITSTNQIQFAENFYEVEPAWDEAIECDETTEIDEDLSFDESDDARILLSVLFDDSDYTMEDITNLSIDEYGNVCAVEFFEVEPSFEITEEVDDALEFDDTYEFDDTEEFDILFSYLFDLDKTMTDIEMIQFDGTYKIKSNKFIDGIS